MSFNLRKRLISPGSCFDEDLADLSDLHWRVFVSLPMIADRAGFMEDRPRRIKAAILPMHDCSANEVSIVLDDLAKVGKITRQSCGNVALIKVHGWAKHQSPHHKEPESALESAFAKHEASMDQAKANVDPTIPPYPNTDPNTDTDIYPGNSEGDGGPF